MYEMRVFPPYRKITQSVKNYGKKIDRKIHDKCDLEYSSFVTVYA